MSALNSTPLGQPSAFTSTYTPSLLCALNRSDARNELTDDHGLMSSDTLPFKGEDVWTGYELSWLNGSGKPEIAGLRVRVPCTSTCLVESKSLKLYLNSFSQTRFQQKTEVLQTIDQDLSLAFRAPVMVELLDLTTLVAAPASAPGMCLDNLDVRIDTYNPDPTLLVVDGEGQTELRESMHTNLFRSVCPVTGQPDWGTILIECLGPPIDRASLLKYLVSYREHAAFHESVIEQIYLDMAACCKPRELTVQGRFVRRGGLDINPFRSNVESQAPVLRLARQ